MEQLTQEQIERRYSLNDRLAAVITMVHALDYLANWGRIEAGLGSAMELLRDGIKNALDHRATGREFRTLRHSRMAQQDPMNHPNVAEVDRRCQRCGAVNPERFSRCPHEV